MCGGLFLIAATIRRKLLVIRVTPVTLFKKYRETKKMSVYRRNIRNIHVRKFEEN